MIASGGQAPELHVQVDELDIIDPKVERRRSPSGSVRRPAKSKACDVDRGPESSATNYHADGPEYLEDALLLETPVADCGDDRGDVCKDYNDWVQAWTEIKG